MLADRTRMSSVARKLEFPPFIYNRGFEASSFFVLNPIEGMSFNKSINYMRMEKASTPGTVFYFNVTTILPLDVTNYNTLAVELEVSGSGQFRLMLSNTQEKKLFSNDFIARSFSLTSSLTLSCDISNYNGLMYPHLNLYGDKTQTSTVYVYKIWLE